MNLLSLFRETDETESYSMGQAIFKEGDLGEFMYVILAGNVEIKLGEKVVETAGPGDLFGEMALIDSTGRSATAVAASDCKCAPVDKKRFTFLVQQHPFFALHVMQVLKDRVVRQDRLIRTM